MECTGIKGLSRLWKRQYSQNRPCRVIILNYKQFMMRSIAFMHESAAVEFGTQ